MRFTIMIMICLEAEDIAAVERKESFRKIVGSYSKLWGTGCDLKRAAFHFFPRMESKHTLKGEAKNGVLI